MAGSSSAADAHVLAVGAVGPSPDAVATVQQRRLRPLAVDVVQEDQADALAERPVCHDLSVAPAGRRGSLKSVTSGRSRRKVQVENTQNDMGDKELFILEHIKG